MTGKHLARYAALLALAHLLAQAREAQAARRGILLYGTPQQQVEASYQFIGQQQEASSQRHETAEDYSFRVRYGIGRPSLWQGSFATTLRLDQSLLSSSRSDDSDFSSRASFLYDINGVLMGNSPAPGAFSLKSDITQVSTPFARTYQVRNDIYDLRWTLRNKRVPVAVEYLTGTSETSGQQVDSKRERDELFLHASHAGVIGTAFLDLSRTQSDFSTTDGETDFDRSYEARLQHQFNWNSGGLERGIGTSLNYSETAGINDAKYLSLSESLHWALGKTLRTGADYAYSTVSGDPGSQNRQSGSLWLQHQLFRNLTTRFSLRARQDEYPTGSDQEVGGGLSLAYIKELPNRGSLSLSGSKDYSVNDRNLGTDRQFIFNEQHTASFGNRINLVQANAVRESIVVRNSDPLRRLDPYVLDLHYRVEQVGALTQIVVLPGVFGGIEDGDLLLVSYDIRVDPNLKTVSDAYSVSGSLSLNGGAYRIYASQVASQQDRTGQVTLTGLTEQSSFRVGAERKWALVTLNTEYNDFDSEADKHQSVLAQLLYSKSRREGTVTMSLSEQYQWYAPITVGETVVRRDAENFFSAAASYSTRLSSTTHLALNSNYLNITGAGSSDSLTVGSSLRWGMGKMNVILNASLGVRRQDNIYGYNERVHLRVTRFF